MESDAILIDNLEKSIETASSIPDKETVEATNTAYLNELNSANLVNIKANIEARGLYSNRIFYMTAFWLIFVVIAIAFQGFGIIRTSDSVIVSLLGTTTLNVLGFFVIVIQYLFNKDKST